MKTSFIDILTNNKIVIPIIQRDYAQGRTDIKTSKIRKSFLDAIFEVLQERATKASVKTLDLDFIYGFSKTENDQIKFSPIDGQQRLTTLWLLLWYVSLKENISPEETVLLSNFKYETRHSTTVFCEQLIKKAKDLTGINIAKEVKDQPWYFEAWDFDPGIKAMIIMLIDIESRYKQLDSNKVWDLFSHTQNPFYFYKLDMEKVGLPDDLYIKMNSRGKPLTDFEYFKAGFLDVITNDGIKKRFEASVDQQWAESIWAIVLGKEKGNKNADIALLVDACFMRFINFISDVLAYKQGLSFTDINHSIEDTKAIYYKEENLIFLFDLLDVIVELQNNNPGFWNDLFYLNKHDFSSGKSRLFFQNSRINLLEKCLFSYDKNGSGFSFSEQLLLFACLIHLLKKTPHFNWVARIVRNLVANSENELRVAKIGESFTDIELFVQKLLFSQLEHFKSDQIKEEEEKYDFIHKHPDFAEHIFKLEDSDIFRGCISVFDLDDKFIDRKNTFLNLFEEDIIYSDFENRSNCLLCFGDYSQDDGVYTNLLTRSKSNWRTFFTTPAYNKKQLNTNTKTVLMDCLDFFNTNPLVSPQQKITETLSVYQNRSKDWIYYFLQYPKIRQGCNKGYYYWDDNNPYPLFKMKEKQFNGYHWDPFLIEIKREVGDSFLELENGGSMQITSGNDLLQIKNIATGYILENINDDQSNNTAFDKLINGGIITNNSIFDITQNSDGLDTEDRIKKGIDLVKQIINN